MPTVLVTMELEGPGGKRFINYDPTINSEAFGPVFGFMQRDEGPFSPPNYKDLETTGTSFYTLLLGGWIPKQWCTGLYRLKVTVREEITGLQDSAEYEFIVSNKGEEFGPSPTGLLPALVSLNAKEMPPGWRQVLDFTDRYAIEGLVAQNYRTFEKRNGTLKKEINNSHICLFPPKKC